MEDLNVELETALAAVRDAMCVAGMYARQYCGVRDAGEYAAYTRAAEVVTTLAQVDKMIVGLAWDRELDANDASN